MGTKKGNKGIRILLELHRDWKDRGFNWTVDLNWVFDGNPREQQMVAWIGQMRDQIHQLGTCRKLWWKHQVPALQSKDWLTIGAWERDRESGI